MKKIAIPLLVFIQVAWLHAQVNQKNKTVSFTTTIDLRNATKEGIYLNGYVVNIPYDTLVKLQGKKVRIRGSYIIVSAVNNDTSTVIAQGRSADVKHIVKPVITVL